MSKLEKKYGVAAFFAASWSKPLAILPIKLNVASVDSGLNCVPSSTNSEVVLLSFKFTVNNI